MCVWCAAWKRCFGVQVPFGRKPQHSTSPFPVVYSLNLTRRKIHISRNIWQGEQDQTRHFNRWVERALDHVALNLFWKKILFDTSNIVFVSSSFMVPVSHKEDFEGRWVITVLTAVHLALSLSPLCYQRFLRIDQVCMSRWEAMSRRSYVEVYFFPQSPPNWKEKEKKIFAQRLSISATNVSICSRLKDTSSLHLLVVDVI